MNVYLIRFLNEKFVELIFVNEFIIRSLMLSFLIPHQLNLSHFQISRLFVTKNLIVFLKKVFMVHTIKRKLLFSLMIKTFRYY